MQVFPTSVNCTYQMSENILPQLPDHVHFSLYIPWQEIVLPQKLAYKIIGSILIEEERKINFHIKL